MTDQKAEQPDLDLAAEFHEKMGEASTQGLTYQNTLEKQNSALIKEGEELMARRTHETVKTKSKLQILRETLTGWIKRK